MWESWMWVSRNVERERSKQALRARIEHCLETACQLEIEGDDERLRNVYLWNALKWEERLHDLEEDK